MIDLFSRRVVGWSMSASMTAQLVANALLMAIRRRGKPDALMHHSDRVSQYVSEQFQRLIGNVEPEGCRTTPSLLNSGRQPSSKLNTDS
ncbi:hypothetical protein ACM42_11600 [Bradyrhizobium sp. CCBAU 25338]|nr:hypothetical protein [Bradyrhizobium sp. CCBAU 25338]